MITPNIRRLVHFCLTATSVLLFSLTTTVIHAHSNSPIVKKEITTSILDDLVLKGDRFNKRKAKAQLRAAIGNVGTRAADMDILELHKAALQLIRQYPSAAIKIQQLTSDIAAEVGYSLRFHTNGESIIYGVLRANSQAVAEEVAPALEIEVPSNTQQVETTPAIALDISAYPNPTTEDVTISLTGKAIPTFIKMVDMTGKEIYKTSLQQFDGQYQKTINIGKFATGIVTIHVEQGEKAIQQKLFVVR